MEFAVTISVLLAPTLKPMFVPIASVFLAPTLRLMLVPIVSVWSGTVEVVVAIFPYVLELDDVSVEVAVAASESGIITSNRQHCFLSGFFGVW